MCGAGSGSSSPTGPALTAELIERRNRAEKRPSRIFFSKRILSPPYLLDVFIQLFIMQFSYQIFIANISVYIITLTIFPKGIKFTKKLISINPGRKCPYF